MSKADKVDNKYAALELKNQICFPLYAASNKITRRYKPLLDKLDLTYTQYITMMVMWERKEINEKTLGECLFLKSNTLAPLLKKLEKKGYIKIAKNKEDSREIIISITKKGEELKEKAIDIPNELSKDLKISREELKTLYKILYEILYEDNK